MKILMLTPYLPYPPSSGGQVRSYNLLKYLGTNHEITLFSLIKYEQEKKYIPKIKKFCRKVRVFKRPEKPWSLRNILKTGFSFYPFLVVRNLSSEEKGVVKEELSKDRYDLIHAETFYVMPHIPQTTVPILLVEQTIEYQVYQHYAHTAKNLLLKPFLFMDVVKIKFWETRFWRKASKVIAVSEADKKKMLSLIPTLDVGVVPNGAGEDLLSLWEKRGLRKKPIIFFQANFLWLQNTEAAMVLAQKVFPLIKKKIPQAVCWIVGQAAGEKIGWVASKDIVVRNLDVSDIEGVRKAYRQATVFVAPLAGPGGTRLKILGAMAAGVPVVTTSVGIEGIGAQDRRQILIGNNPEQLAKAAVQLIKDKKLSKDIIWSARKLVEKKYTYKTIASVLDKFYQEVAYGKG
jgi:glycosyltransferase involved in cell wall biosynthesis